MNHFSKLLLLVIFCSTLCFADERDNVQVATDMVQAINDRDLDRLDEYLAPDFIRHSAATANISVTSLDDFKNFLREDFTGVPDSIITIDIVFGNDEYVALRAVYAGTQSGEMGPFPPSGKHVELPYIGILRFTDGKISEMWVEWDNIFMLTQLGYFPPPKSESE